VTTIKKLREDRGIAPAELAASAGISLAEYYDLELQEDELHMGASIETIARVAHRLGVKPSSFFEGMASRQISLHELASGIAEHVTQTGRSLGELEENVGWSLAGALETPSRFLDFPAVGLRDVCSPLGVNWLDVLDGIFADLGVLRAPGVDGLRRR
jgi:transcriptional regulator with XRE-family HTH domain